MWTMSLDDRMELAAILSSRASKKHKDAQYAREKEHKRQCRWCRAPSTACKARTKYVQDEIRADFETIVYRLPVSGNAIECALSLAAEQPAVPTDNTKLASAFGAVPFIRQWCATVEAEVTGHPSLIEALERDSSRSRQLAKILLSDEPIEKESA